MAIRDRGMTQKKDGADVLAERLAVLGWTQAQCEAELGLGDGIVCRWLSRARKPDLTSALILQDRLGIPVPLWADESRRG